MTRKTKREIEKQVDELDTDDGDGGGLHVVYENPETGTYYDLDGNAVEPSGDGVVIVVLQTVVMEREQAEAEGREILGPAEDTNDAGDWVQVVPEWANYGSESGEPSP